MASEYQTDAPASQPIHVEQEHGRLLHGLERRSSQDDLTGTKGYTKMGQAARLDSESRGRPDTTKAAGTVRSAATVATTAAEGGTGATTGSRIQAAGSSWA